MALSTTVGGVTSTTVASILAGLAVSPGLAAFSSPMSRCTTVMTGPLLLGSFVVSICGIFLVFVVVVVIVTSRPRVARVKHDFSFRREVSFGLGVIQVDSQCHHVGL